jgi:glycosyltransferase involved in cell wall biosynthesis
MLEYLDTFGTRYDAVIFFSYLYATTYFGLPLVEDRSILAPLAHEEWPMAFSLWDRFFARPRSFVYASHEERAFVKRRFAALSLDGPIAGVGIDAPADADADRFRRETGIRDPFALYVGRVDPAKGCDELLADFKRFRNTSATIPTLVLIGEPHMAIEADANVVVLGPLPERAKWDALAAAEIFVMPSSNESLSIAVLEAWSQGLPALVNGRCETLVGQCRRSAAGLWYSNADEFSVIMDMLDPETRKRLGANGRRFVQAEYGWERVTQIYLNLLREVQP